MARELTPIDISTAPDLLRLAEQVRARQESYVLRRGGEDIAVLRPVSPSAKRRRTQLKNERDMVAFWSSFGGWKDVETEQLVADIYESRRISTRPPVDL